jgi:high-affinity nickel-transport protein
LAKELGLSGGIWGFLSGFDMNRAGFVIAGVFAATWLVALAIWHFAGIEQKWERPPTAYAPASGDR